MDSQRNEIYPPGSIDERPDDAHLRETLPIPEENDNLETVAKKMEDLAAVVKRGGNIATATGFKPLTRPEHNSIIRARNSMTSDEASQYDSWLKGYFLFPSMDWDANTEHVPTGIDALKYMDKRAQALNEVYGVNIANAENALWFTQKHEDLLPCLDAVAKVQYARRTQNKTQTELYGMQLAEIQIIHSAKAVANRVTNDVFQQYNDLYGQIKDSMEIIKDRCDAVKKHANEREQARKDAEDLKRAVASANNRPIRYTADESDHGESRIDTFMAARRGGQTHRTTRGQTNYNHLLPKQENAEEESRHYNLRDVRLRGTGRFGRVYSNGVATKTSRSSKRPRRG